MSKEVHLAPLCIKPSKQLWYAQLLFGFLLISASLFAISYVIVQNASYITVERVGYLSTQNTQWLLLELSFLCVMSVWIVQCYKSSIQSTLELRVFSGTIFINNIMPELDGVLPKSHKDQKEVVAKIKGEMLVWPWIIIVPLVLSEEALRDDKNKYLRLIVLQDSCSQEEWRQLRVYLLNRG